MWSPRWEGRVDAECMFLLFYRMSRPTRAGRASPQSCLLDTRLFTLFLSPLFPWTQTEGGPLYPAPHRNANSL